MATEEESQRVLRHFVGIERHESANFRQCSTEEILDILLGGSAISHLADQTTDTLYQDLLRTNPRRAFERFRGEVYQIANHAIICSTLARQATLLSPQRSFECLHRMFPKAPVLFFPLGTPAFGGNLYTPDSMLIIDQGRNRLQVVSFFEYTLTRNPEHFDEKYRRFINNRYNHKTPFNASRCNFRGPVPVEELDWKIPECASYKQSSLDYDMFEEYAQKLWEQIVISGEHPVLNKHISSLPLGYSPRNSRVLTQR